jgi:hypothetical protein
VQCLPNQLIGHIGPVELRGVDVVHAGIGRSTEYA